MCTCALDFMLMYLLSCSVRCFRGTEGPPSESNIASYVLYVYIYIYIYALTYNIYIYIERERDRQTDRHIYIYI